MEKAYNYELIKNKLTACCNHYEKSAPVVSHWADDLYIRIQDDPYHVSIWELITLDKLFDVDWIQPNYATNTVYKCMDILHQNILCLLSF